jgi:hypothetical protein
MSLCPTIVAMRSCAAGPCPPAIKLAAIGMATHAAEDGSICASFAEVAEWSGISLHAVCRALQRLKEVGMLAVVAGARTERRTYRLTVEVRHG